MRSMRRGFTIIEVVLVMAISAALLAAIIGTTSVTVYRTRYKDAVDDVVDQLRKAYSSVLNVQNERDNADGGKYCSISSIWNGNTVVENTLPQTNGEPGRTDCAIYGKLITFGELDSKGNTTNTIHTYNVVGKVDGHGKFNGQTSDYGGNAVLQALSANGNGVGVNVVAPRTVNGTCDLVPIGQSTSYIPLWDASMKTVDKKPYRAAVLIVRSPLTGTVHTFSWEGSTVDVQRELEGVIPVKTACNNAQVQASFLGYRNKFLDLTKFKDKDAVLCVDSEDTIAYGYHRRAIKILADGQNTSAVKLVDMDSEENVCR